MVGKHGLETFQTKVYKQKIDFIIFNTGVCKLKIKIDKYAHEKYWKYKNF